MTNTTDYAALELRALELMAAAPVRTSALLDIHTITTAVMLGKMYSEVTKPQRNNVGKTMNFAMLYTPGAMWEVPSEMQLMRIWADEEKEQLCHKLGVTEPDHLYKVLTNHFNTAYKAAE